MDGSLVINDSASKTFMPWLRRDHAEVSQSPRQILARNLELLMSAHSDLGAQARVAAKAGVSQKTVGRALHQTNAADVDSLNGLAKAFKIQPWQLLHPELQVVVDESGFPVALVPAESRLSEPVRRAIEKLDDARLRELDNVLRAFLAVRNEAVHAAPAQITGRAIRNGIYRTPKKVVDYLEALNQVSEAFKRAGARPSAKEVLEAVEHEIREKQRELEEESAGLGS